MTNEAQETESFYQELRNSRVTLAKRALCHIKALASDLESARQECEALRADLQALRDEKPVATILAPDPYDECPGVALTPSDWRALEHLPPNTTLYARIPK